MESLFVIIILFALLGLLLQFIGLLYYFFRGTENEEEHKDTALQLLVYGTALLLGSGVVCGIGVSFA